MSVQQLKRRFVLLVFLLSSPLVIAQNNVAQGSQTAQVASSTGQIQGQETSGKTITNPDGSTLSNNHYQNRFFDFTIDFPTGWLLFNSTEAKAGMEENKRKFIEAHPDMAYANNPNSGDPLLVVGEATAYKSSTTRRTFKILANDASGEDPRDTSVDYLNFIARMSKEGKLPFEFLTAPQFVTINGKKLGKAYVKMPWEGQVWFSAMYALRVKTYILQFIYISPDREGLAELEQLIETLKFGSEKVQP